MKKKRSNIQPPSASRKRDLPQARLVVQVLNESLPNVPNAGGVYEIDLLDYLDEIARFRMRDKRYPSYCRPAPASDREQQINGAPVATFGAPAGQNNYTYGAGCSGVDQDTMMGMGMGPPDISTFHQYDRTSKGAMNKRGGFRSLDIADADVSIVEITKEKMDQDPGFTRSYPAQNGNYGRAAGALRNQQHGHQHHGSPAAALDAASTLTDNSSFSEGFLVRDDESRPFLDMQKRNRKPVSKRKLPLVPGGELGSQASAAAAQGTMRSGNAYATKEMNTSRSPNYIMDVDHTIFYAEDDHNVEAEISRHAGEGDEDTGPQEGLDNRENEDDEGPGDSAEEHQEDDATRGRPDRRGRKEHTPQKGSRVAIHAHTGENIGQPPRYHGSRAPGRRNAPVQNLAELRQPHVAADPYDLDPIELLETLTPEEAKYIISLELGYKVWRCGLVPQHLMELVAVTEDSSRHAAEFRLKRTQNPAIASVLSRINRAGGYQPALLKGQSRERVGEILNGLADANKGVGGINGSGSNGKHQGSGSNIDQSMLFDGDIDFEEAGPGIVRTSGRLGPMRLGAVEAESAFSSVVGRQQGRGEVVKSKKSLSSKHHKSSTQESEATTSKSKRDYARTLTVSEQEEDKRRYGELLKYARATRWNSIGKLGVAVPADEINFRESDAGALEEKYPAMASGARAVTCRHGKQLLVFLPPQTPEMEGRLNQMATAPPMQYPPAPLYTNGSIASPFSPFVMGQNANLHPALLQQQHMQIVAGSFPPIGAIGVGSSGLYHTNQISTNMNTFGGHPHFNAVDSMTLFADGSRTYYVPQTRDADRALTGDIPGCKTWRFDLFNEEMTRNSLRMLEFLSQYRVVDSTGPATASGDMHPGAGGGAGFNGGFQNYGSDFNTSSTNRLIDQTMYAEEERDEVAYSSDEDEEEDGGRDQKNKVGGGAETTRKAMRAGRLVTRLVRQIEVLLFVSSCKYVSVELYEASQSEGMIAKTNDWVVDQDEEGEEEGNANAKAAAGADGGKTSKADAKRNPQKGCGSPSVKLAIACDPPQQLQMNPYPSARLVRELLQRVNSLSHARELVYAMRADDLNSVDRKGNNIILKAFLSAAAHFPEKQQIICQAVLEQCPRFALLNNVDSEDGRTLLHLAALHNWGETMTKLLGAQGEWRMESTNYTRSALFPPLHPFAGRDAADRRGNSCMVEAVDRNDGRTIMLLLKFALETPERRVGWRTIPTAQPGANDEDDDGDSTIRSLAEPNVDNRYALGKSLPVGLTGETSFYKENLEANHDSAGNLIEFPLLESTTRQGHSLLLHAIYKRREGVVLKILTEICLLIKRCATNNWRDDHAQKRSKLSDNLVAGRAHSRYSPEYQMPPSQTFPNKPGVQIRGYLGTSQPVVFQDHNIATGGALPIMEPGGELPASSAVGAQYARVPHGGATFYESDPHRWPGKIPKQHAGNKNEIVNVNLGNQGVHVSDFDHNRRVYRKNPATGKLVPVEGLIPPVEKAIAQRAMAGGSHMHSQFSEQQSTMTVHGFSGVGPSSLMGMYRHRNTTDNVSAALQQQYVDPRITDDFQELVVKPKDADPGVYRKLLFDLLNFRDQDGRTLLSAACSMGMVRVVEVLLGELDEGHSLNNQGITAAQQQPRGAASVSPQRGQPRKTNKAGGPRGQFEDHFPAGPEAVVREGLRRSSSQMAAERGYARPADPSAAYLTALLRPCGFLFTDDSVNAVDLFGKNALHYAIARREYEICNLLFFSRRFRAYDDPEIARYFAERHYKDIVPLIPRLLANLEKRQLQNDKRERLARKRQTNVNMKGRGNKGLLDHPKNEEYEDEDDEFDDLEDLIGDGSRVDVGERAAHERMKSDLPSARGGKRKGGGQKKKRVGASANLRDASSAIGASELRGESGASANQEASPTSQPVTSSQEQSRKSARSPRAMGIDTLGLGNEQQFSEVDPDLHVSASQRLPHIRASASGSPPQHLPVSSQPPSAPLSPIARVDVGDAREMLSPKGGSNSRMRLPPAKRPENHSSSMRTRNHSDNRSPPPQAPPYSGSTRSHDHLASRGSEGQYSRSGHHSSQERETSNDESRASHRQAQQNFYNNSNRGHDGAAIKGPGGAGGVFLEDEELEDFRSDDIHDESIPRVLEDSVVDTSHMDTFYSRRGEGADEGRHAAARPDSEQGMLKNDHNVACWNNSTTWYDVEDMSASSLSKNRRGRSPTARPRVASPADDVPSVLLSLPSNLASPTSGRGGSLQLERAAGGSPNQHRRNNAASRNFLFFEGEHEAENLASEDAEEGETEQVLDAPEENEELLRSLFGEEEEEQQGIELVLESEDEENVSVQASPVVDEQDDVLSISSPHSPQQELFEGTHHMPLRLSGGLPSNKAADHRKRGDPTPIQEIKQPMGWAGTDVSVRDRLFGDEADSDSLDREKRKASSADLLVEERSEGSEDSVPSSGGPYQGHPLQYKDEEKTLGLSRSNGFNAGGGSAKEEEDKRNSSEETSCTSKMNKIGKPPAAPKVKRTNVKKDHGLPKDKKLVMSKETSSPSAPHLSTKQLVDGYALSQFEKAGWSNVDGYFRQAHPSLNVPRKRSVEDYDEVFRITYGGAVARNVYTEKGALEVGLYDEAMELSGVSDPVLDDPGFGLDTREQGFYTRELCRDSSGNVIGFKQAAERKSDKKEYEQRQRVKMEQKKEKQQQQQAQKKQEEMASQQAALLPKKKVDHASLHRDVIEHQKVRRNFFVDLKTGKELPKGVRVTHLTKDNHVIEYYDVNVGPGPGGPLSPHLEVENQQNVKTHKPRAGQQHSGVSPGDASTTDDGVTPQDHSDAASTADSSESPQRTSYANPYRCSNQPYQYLGKKDGRDYYLATLNQGDDYVIASTTKPDDVDAYGNKIVSEAEHPKNARSTLKQQQSANQKANAANAKGKKGSSSTQAQSQVPEKEREKSFLVKAHMGSAAYEPRAFLAKVHDHSQRPAGVPILPPVIPGVGGAIPESDMHQIFPPSLARGTTEQQRLHPQKQRRQMVNGEMSPVVDGKNAFLQDNTARTQLIPADNIRALLNEEQEHVERALDILNDRTKWVFPGSESDLPPRKLPKLSTNVFIAKADAVERPFTDYNMRPKVAQGRDMFADDPFLENFLKNEFGSTTYANAMQDTSVDHKFLSPRNLDGRSHNQDPFRASAEELNALIAPEPGLVAQYHERVAQKALENKLVQDHAHSESEEELRDPGFKEQLRIGTPTSYATSKKSSVGAKARAQELALLQELENERQTAEQLQHLGDFETGQDAIEVRKRAILAANGSKSVSKAQIGRWDYYPSAIIEPSGKDDTVARLLQLGFGEEVEDFYDNDPINANLDPAKIQHYARGRSLEYKAVVSCEKIKQGTLTLSPRVPFRGEGRDQRSLLPENESQLVNWMSMMNYAVKHAPTNADAHEIERRIEVRKKAEVAEEERHAWEEAQRERRRALEEARVAVEAEKAKQKGTNLLAGEGSADRKDPVLGDGEGGETMLERLLAGEGGPQEDGTSSTAKAKSEEKKPVNPLSVVSNLHRNIKKIAHRLAKSSPYFIAEEETPEQKRKAAREAKILQRQQALQAHKEIGGASTSAGKGMSTTGMSGMNQDGGASPGSDAFHITTASNTASMNPLEALLEQEPLDVRGSPPGSPGSPKSGGLASPGSPTSPSATASNAASPHAILGGAPSPRRSMTFSLAMAGELIAQKCMTEQRPAVRKLGSRWM
ncbi:unnamed protein product [Amoebophrya sp. A25]|nr:unnamed protein product [Amoebophrya sp. A25]|eukprot:GSA25T00008454001.1